MNEFAQSKIGGKMEIQQDQLNHAAACAIFLANVALKAEEGGHDAQDIDNNLKDILAILQGIEVV